MTKYFYFLLFLFIACKSNKKLLYQDSSNKFYVTFERSQKNGNADSLYTFYDFNNPSEIKKVGFYKDGFRNDLWSYNLSEKVDTIKWGYFKDKYLNFETNLFSYADSITHGDFFTNFLFTTTNGKIVLTISVNSPFKDSLPESNYERLTKNEFSTIGVMPLYFNAKKLNEHLFINDISIKTSKDEVKYIKGAYGFIDKNYFIELSVSSSTKDNFFANELFNAVLTNFEINGHLLYNPFIK